MPSFCWHVSVYNVLVEMNGRWCSPGPCEINYTDSVSRSDPYLVVSSLHSNRWLASLSTSVYNTTFSDRPKYILLRECQVASI